MWMHCDGKNPLEIAAAIIEMRVGGTMYDTESGRQMTLDELDDVISYLGLYLKNERWHQRKSQEEPEE